MTMHGELAAGRWNTLSLAEQLANVGSEVERAMRSWEARRTDRFERALERALELFDLTVCDKRWRGHRRREILRTREEFLTFFYGDPSPGSADGLRKYFLQFAVYARRQGDGQRRPPSTRLFESSDAKLGAESDLFRNLEG